MKIKKFLLGGLLAVAGFASVFAIIQPDIRGWTTTNTASLTTDWMIIQSGTDQKKITVGNLANSISGSLGLSGFLTGFTETDPVRTSVSGDFYPFSGNDPTKPIYGDFYMAVGSGSFNLEVLTGIDLGLGIAVDIPVLTPTAFIPAPGPGIFKIMLTKGRQFFMGEPGQNTSMYMANSTGNIGWKLDSDDSQARFILQPFTGGAMAGLMGYTQWNANGTIQAGNTGIVAAINAGVDETYVTKGWVNTQGIRAIDATKIYTNNTGIIGFQVGNAIAGTIRSIAIGEGAITDNDSIAIGAQNVASGNNSAAIGYANYSLKQDAYGFGRSNRSYTYKSLLLGYENTSYTTNLLGGVFALGEDNNIRSYDTFVMGRLNNSTGESNMIIGLDNNFSGARMYGFGQSLISTGFDRYIFGQYNLPISGSMFEFGNGVGGIRSTAMAIMANGTMQAGNTGIDTLITAGPDTTYITKGWLSGYVNSNYLPRANVATSITYPGSDTLVPTTKAVVDYIDLFTTLESVITTGAFILSGNTPIVACAGNQLQIANSGGAFSFQACSGTTWVEVGNMFLP